MRPTKRTRECRSLRSGTPKSTELFKKKLGTQKHAAEIFGFSNRSVNRIWARYNAGVSRLLPNKKRGVQVGIKSNGRQAAEVR